MSEVKVVCNHAGITLHCNGCEHAGPHTRREGCAYLCPAVGEVMCDVVSTPVPPKPVRCNSNSVGIHATGVVGNSRRDVEPSGSMPLEELLELHKSTTERCREVMRKKNHDYTCAGGVFDNFKASEMIGVHPVLGILMRTMDKFKRIQTFITKGKLAVEGEGVLDAIDDSINYLILVKGIIIEEQRMKK